MQSATPKGLEETLHREGILTQEQLDTLHQEIANTGKPIEDILIENNMVSADQLTKAQASTLGVPYINLNEVTSTAEILNYIPEPIAKRYAIFAFHKENDQLSVAMADPLDSQLIQFLEQKTGLKVQPYMAPTEKILDVISDQYSHNLSSDVNAALKETGSFKPTEKQNIEAEKRKSEEIIREAPVAKIVSTILEFGIKARASDVHIEPLEDKTRIRYRIDGILQEKLVLPVKVHDAVVSRIKILADMKIDERRIPQDGRFNFKMEKDEVDLRVSTLPTVHGEKVVMRLLKKTGGVPTLTELGLRGTALKNFEQQVLRPHGIILITGPTGSGKTTTLYSILTKIKTPKVNIVTLEDPVEYQMAGVNQVQINPQAGLTFASGLRSFLRQDPNIIMVGEIRDSETAGLAIQAALTGHLVFSTIHTNSAAGALPRLLDMGGEPFLISSSVSAIEAQRVVRKICNSCKTDYDPPEEIIEDLKEVLGSLYDAALKRGDGKQNNSATSAKLYKGNGCKECGDTGYSGRIGIYEVLVVSEKIGRLILEHKTSADIERQAREEGMITMKQDGYLKVMEGLTTLEEILRVAQD